MVIGTFLLVEQKLQSNWSACLLNCPKPPAHFHAFSLEVCSYKPGCFRVRWFFNQPRMAWGKEVCWKMFERTRFQLHSKLMLNHMAKLLQENEGSHDALLQCQRPAPQPALHSSIATVRFKPVTLRACTAHLAEEQRCTAEKRGCEPPWSTQVCKCWLRVHRKTAEQTESANSFDSSAWLTSNMLEEASCPTPSKSNIESRHSDIEPWRSRLQTWKGVIFWYLKYCKISLLLVLEMKNEISISLSVQHWHFFPLFSLIFGDVQLSILLHHTETPNIASWALLKLRWLHWSHGLVALKLYPTNCPARSAARVAAKPYTLTAAGSWKGAKVAFGESTVSQTLLKQRGATEKMHFAFDLAYFQLFKKFNSAWVVTIERLLNVFLLVWVLCDR